MQGKKRSIDGGIKILGLPFFSSNTAPYGTRALGVGAHELEEGNVTKPDLDDYPVASKTANDG